MEIKGKVKFMSADIQVLASFKKRELVVSTDEQYPQHILINFVQDKVDLLDKFKVGDFVEVGINIRGREWVSAAGETKYFNDIQGWKISYDKERPMPQVPINDTVVHNPVIVNNSDDDLPF